jgi:hypothetical protein
MEIIDSIVGAAKRPRERGWGRKSQYRFLPPDLGGDFDANVNRFPNQTQFWHFHRDTPR